MAPSISKREWIKWEPDGPSEPTNTIVTTSPQNRFVDIRILKHAEPSTIPISLDDLDWAFAGTSSSSWKTGPNGEKLTHSVWKHWIDSETTHPENKVDEGDMVPTLNDKMIERGQMVNPATGRMTNYEECWIDVEPTSTAKGEKVVCAVLVLEDEKHGERGMVVRVGQFCQGVMRNGEEFTCERWEWTREDGWKRSACVGRAWMPCGVAMESEKLVLGGKVTYLEQVWEVVELS